MLKLCKILCVMISLSVATPVISEWMADPASVSDATGEYFEIFDSSQSWTDSLYLGVNGKIIPLGKVSFSNSMWRVWAASEIIKDADTLEQWPSLLNSSPVDLVLYGPQSQILDQVQVPKAVAGKSWERFNASWQLSTVPMSSADLGSPGWSGRIQDQRAFKIQKFACSPTQFDVQMELPVGVNALALSQDQDMDGVEDEEADTVWGDNGIAAKVLVRNDEYLNLRVVVAEATDRIGEVWDTLLLCPGQSWPWALTEIFPAPNSNQMEWFEILSTSARTISLENWSWVRGNDTGSMAGVLRARSQTIWVSDLNQAQSIFAGYNGAIQSLPAWPGLPNDGDTLVLLGPDRQEIDRVSWSTARSGNAWVLDRNGDWKWVARPSPGFDWISKEQVVLASNQIHRAFGEILLWGSPEFEGEIELYALDGRLKSRAQWNSGSLFMRVPIADLRLGKSYLIWRPKAGETQRWELEILP